MSTNWYGALSRKVAMKESIATRNAGVVLAEVRMEELVQDS